ncbi:hypothetical protein ZOSMA_10G01140 [Zostera marina]|uniref:Proteasome maturation factor UMP1 n=1 Tax=Zostera marina TaxID=29655 RepID=A0A0K9Q5R2_ZOSMR|nr:hypothetical protein ZOSMA_10G01140 [Zostera marina]
MEMTKRSIENDPTAIQNDTLRFGFHGVRSEIVGNHPLQSSHQLTKKNQEETKRVVLANTYGTAFTTKMDLDMQMFSRFQRPPGPLPSSMLGLDALTGNLDEFGFEDYLNDPRDSENIVPADMHHGMEVRLGLSKGPVCPSFT